jgi:hypothetical protein
LSYSGHRFWKVDGILSGLELEALDYLLPDLYSSENRWVFVSYFHLPSFSISYKECDIFMVATYMGVFTSLG